MGITLSFKISRLGKGASPRFRRGGVLPPGPGGRQARLRLPQLPRLQRRGQEGLHSHQYRGNYGHSH